MRCSFQDFVCSHLDDDYCTTTIYDDNEVLWSRVSGVFQRGLAMNQWMDGLLEL
jgi:hypothetical protein